MDRRIDEFRLHCGPHPCFHDDAEDAPKAWRYAVIDRDYAYSLTVCKSSGEMALHRTFLGPGEIIKEGCDLVGGLGCIYHDEGVHVADGQVSTPAGVLVDQGLLFWAQYASPGQREQPPRFWRALERRARSAAKSARAERYHQVRCPRCAGIGMIVLKPKVKASKEGSA